MTDDEAAGESDLEDWIRDRFAFLADHGFAVDRVTQYTFQWRNGDRTIQLSREPDGQLDVRFAREAGPSDRKSFWLHQALQVAAAPEAWPSHRWRAWHESTARKYIAELAALVNAHLDALLGNGAELWQQAEDLARDQACANVARLVTRQLRIQADIAWHARNWPTVVDRYDELQATGTPLTGSEAKRLQYARRRSPRSKA
jgi:hypothetical protein